MAERGGDDDDDATMTEKESFLKDASKLGGQFDLRKSKVGLMWQAALKKDPQLREAYNAVGKSYAEQRRFRDQWVQREFKAERSRRSMSETHRTTDEIEGEYLAASVIAIGEGSDEAGVEAACNYVSEAIRRHQRGEKLSTKPYCQFNGWTRRWEFLYLTGKYREAFETSFNKRWDEADHVAAGSSKSAAQGDETERAATDDKKANNTGDDKAANNTGDDKAAPRPKKKPRTTKTDLPQFDPSSPQDAKKVLDGQLTKARQLRTRYDSVVGGYTEIKRRINSDPDWAWAQSPALTADMEKYKGYLEDFKASHPIWSSWTLVQNFGQTAKKNFPNDVNEQLGRLPSLEKTIASLDASIRVILSMNSARAAARPE